MPLKSRHIFSTLNSSKTILPLLSRGQVTASVEHLEEAKPFSAMPQPSGAWPILGHLPHMTKKETQQRMHLAFNDMRKECGDTFRLNIPGEKHGFVILFDAEDVKTLYANDGRVPQIPGFDMFEFIRKNAMKDRYINAGLINNAEDWYTVRHQVQQDMMRPKSALYYIDEMEDIAGELVEKIASMKGEDGQGIKDIHPFIQEYALEAVGCIFLNARLAALKGEGDGGRLIEISEETLPMALKLFFLPHWSYKYLPMFKKFTTLQGEAFDICKRHVVAAISRVQDSDENVIAKLVRACGRESPIPMIMGADALQVGIDTTGSTGAILLYHLADNPSKQEKLYEEICSVIGPSGKMTTSALAKMRYLKACQTESQRMLPAIFGSSRRLISDVVLGGYTVPKDTTVLRIGHMTSNDACNFESPEKFIPERWLRDSNERHSAHPFANLPWGHGARSCIGRRFAQLELYMMMVKIVQRFKMEQEGEPLGVFTNFISLPDRNVNIKFTER